MNDPIPNSQFWLPGPTVKALLQCYDYPHPLKPGKIIRGYDKAHARRTAKMCGAVARYLGYRPERLEAFQVACLLHDMGRAGLDRKVFGAIWSWARSRGIPTRPAEWRAAYPDTVYGKETEAFWKIYRPEVCKLGIEINSWTKEQVEMRLGYARRLRRCMRQIKPVLQRLGIRWSTWMEKVCLYYYYPEKLVRGPAWVRELGEILVACEQLEAYSNRQRGSDYYNRSGENFVAAFSYLDELCRRGQLSRKVLSAVRCLTSKGSFDSILMSARKREFTAKERRFLRSLNPGE